MGCWGQTEIETENETETERGLGSNSKMVDKAELLLFVEIQQLAQPQQAGWWPCLSAPSFSAQSPEKASEKEAFVSPAPSGFLSR